MPNAPVHLAGHGKQNGRSGRSVLCAEDRLAEEAFLSKPPVPPVRWAWVIPRQVTAVLLGTR